MRAQALSLSLLLCATLACDKSNTTASPDDAEATATSPSEVEGPAPDPDADNPDVVLCELGDDWMACDGKRVQIEGRKPEMVMQHPMINGPDTHQGYVDTDQAQLIVLTPAPFSCPGEMLVVGTLERIDMGGDPGTKDSYTGWSVTGAEVTCR